MHQVAMRFLVLMSSMLTVSSAGDWSGKVFMVIIVAGVVKVIVAVAGCYQSH